MRCGSLWVVFDARKGWERVGVRVGCEGVAFRRFPAYPVGSPRVSRVPVSGRLFGGLAIYGDGASGHGFGLFVLRYLCFRLHSLSHAVRTNGRGIPEHGVCVSLPCGVLFGSMLV